MMMMILMMTCDDNDNDDDGVILHFSLLHSYMMGKNVKKTILVPKTNDNYFSEFPFIYFNFFYFLRFNISQYSSIDHSFIVLIMVNLRSLRTYIA